MWKGQGRKLTQATFGPWNRGEGPPPCGKRESLLRRPMEPIFRPAHRLERAPRHFAQARSPTPSPSCSQSHRLALPRLATWLGQRASYTRLLCLRLAVRTGLNQRRELHPALWGRGFRPGIRHAYLAFFVFQLRIACRNSEWQRLGSS